MAYSGNYKVTNKRKYQGNPDNVVYRSLWEKKCFAWCEKTTAVKAWSSEELAIPYFYEVDKRYHRYFPDLVIYFENRTVLVEIKPKKETVPPVFPNKKTKRYITESLTWIKNNNKWDAAAEFAKDRGWDFEIWTEETLQKLGIMPKSVKRMKSLPPLKVKKKK